MSDERASPKTIAEFFGNAGPQWIVALLIAVGAGAWSAHGALSQAQADLRHAADQRQRDDARFGNIERRLETLCSCK